MFLRHPVIPLIRQCVHFKWQWVVLYCIVIVFYRYQNQLCAFLIIMDNIKCAHVSDQMKLRKFFSHKNVVLCFLNMWLSYNWHCRPKSKDYYTRILGHCLTDTRCWFISLLIANQTNYPKLYNIIYVFNICRKCKCNGLVQWRGIFINIKYSSWEISCPFHFLICHWTSLMFVDFVCKKNRRFFRSLLTMKLVIKLYLCAAK
jgi:hypothetical protein